MISPLVEQSWWDASYKKTDLANPPTDPSIKKLLRKYFSLNKGAVTPTVCEIGCFPGSYLNIFGDMGYKISGIDITPRTEELAQHLAHKGHSIGSIEKRSLFDHASTGEKYDMVCSFGLIEHFDDYGEVILKHAELVKDGGKLLITTPNMRGVAQYIMHRITDKENLARHNLDAMQPNMWQKTLEEVGFKIIYVGYYGKFNFWVEYKKRNIVSKLVKNLALAVALVLKKVVFFESRAFSPFCVIIAEKHADLLRNSRL